MELDLLPEKPGVYLMKDQKGEVLYVGKAKILKSRIKQYYLPNRDKRIMVPFLVKQIAHIETLITFTEREALLLENSLIKQHKPKYNVLLKDDKSFLALFLNTNHHYPMAKLVRYRPGEELPGKMFGPYTSALLARKTFEIILRLFPLRQCSDRELASRKRPCILYEMKRCIAPCVHKCTDAEYSQVVAHLVEFLSGKNQKLLANIKQQIQRASDALEFEKAHLLLETLQEVEEISRGSKVTHTSHDKECDVYHFIRQGGSCLLMKLLFREGNLVGSESFPFTLLAGSDEEFLTSFLLQHYEEVTPAEEILLPLPLPDAPLLEDILQVKITSPLIGEKKALVDLAFENAQALFTQEKELLAPLEETLLYLQERLQLNRFPAHIECIDTSHLSGAEMVASVVAFTEGAKDTKKYRLYKIKKAKPGDDYGALEEVLQRHLARAQREDALPDLLLLDGGKGHLSAAQKVLTECNITNVDIAAFTKEEGRHDKGMSAERIFLPSIKESISLNRHSPLLFFLQRIRDEAHRSALAFQKKRRAKQQQKSRLDEIEGIGSKKKQALLCHFGSVAEIAAAPLKALREVALLSSTDCATIYHFFRQGSKEKESSR